MLLTEWAKAWDREHGRECAHSELQYRSRVSYKTVLKAARDGLPVMCEVAEKLSAATRPNPHAPVGPGNEPACSVDEIRFPDKHRATSSRKRPAAAH